MGPTNIPDLKILLDEKTIHTGIEKAANWINQRYAGKEIVLIGLLKGSVPFIGHLLPKITIETELDFMLITSYKNNYVTNKDPKIVLDIIADITNKDVLVVDDIVDSGYTLKVVQKHLKYKAPNSVSTIALLDKKNARQVDINPDFACFQIPNKFVVGFGLDNKGKWRNLPYIGYIPTQKEEI